MSRGGLSTKLKCVAILVVAGVLFGAAWGMGQPVPGLAALILGATASVLVALADLNQRQTSQETHIAGLIRDSARALALDQHSLHVLGARFPTINTPPSDYSMLPYNLQGIILWLDRIGPRTVVEFGCGRSTLYVGAWLRERGEGGKVVSFEHNLAWVDLWRRQVEGLGLADFIEVHHAPLRPRLSLGHQQDWYDADAVLGGLRDVGVVIVDGPPAGTPALALSRLPAMEALYDRLAPKSVVFLDDGHRPGENRVIELWKKSYPDFHADFVSSLSGYWTVSRGVTPVNAGGFTP